MAEHSSIQWTDSTWNPVRGCTKISPGCAHCYAETFAERWRGIPGHPYEQGFDLRLVPEKLADPLKWKPVKELCDYCGGSGDKNDHQACGHCKKGYVTRPRRIFVNSMSDLFHEDVPDGFIMRVLSTMAQAHWHTYQVLTKRADRMRDFFTRWADTTGEDFDDFKNARGPEETRAAHPSPRGQLFAAMLESMGTPPDGCAYATFDWMEGMLRWPDTFPQIWLGVSCEDQKRADERIVKLLQTPAAVRFISAEPLLGPIDIRRNLPGWKRCNGCGAILKMPGVGHPECGCGRQDRSRLSGFGGSGISPADNLDWIITGAESGPKRRPWKPEWATVIQEHCAIAGCAFFNKQVIIDGRVSTDPNEWPESWRVQQFPALQASGV